jgi:hypothetical protein
MRHCTSPLSTSPAVNGLTRSTDWTDTLWVLDFVGVGFALGPPGGAACLPPVVAGRASDPTATLRRGGRLGVMVGSLPLSREGWNRVGGDGKEGGGGMMMMMMGGGARMTYRWT